MKRIPYAYLFLPLVLIGCTTSPQKAVASEPVTASIVGSWIYDSSNQGYTEGIYFRGDGKFVRWGREEEGGWSAGGSYTVQGNQVRFKGDTPNMYNFGKDEDSFEGVAELTWVTESKVVLSGQGRKLALHREPAKKK